MLQYSICAFLAPALASAAAFPWALPEPTFGNAVANWSPAPTQAPGLGAMELFKRASGPNTCGYISAKSSSSLTCNNSDFVCVTNPGNGVHGCCDPSSIAECKIPTTCIASTDMSKSCTDSACSSNDYIAKCTGDTPSCYEWRYVFSTQTVMTEHGCASKGFTISVQFTFSDGSTSSPLPTRVAQSTTAPTSAPSSGTKGDSNGTKSDGSPSSRAPTSPPAVTTSPAAGSVVAPVTKSKSNIGAIVGGVVGGLAVLGALAFAAIFLILRNKKNKQEAAHNAATGASQPMMGPAPGVMEYKPHDPYSPAPPQYPPTPSQQYAAPYSPGPGAAAGYYGHDHKVMHQQLGVPASAPGSPPPPHGMAPFAPPGVVAPVEAGGTEIPAPASRGPKPNPVYEAP